MRERKHQIKKELAGKSGAVPAALVIPASAGIQ